MEIIIAPSILAGDFKILGEQIEKTEKGGAKYLHFDVMDGHFVPSISYGMPVLKSIKGYTNQVLDVHLMIDEPIRYIKDFANSGADIITVHLEACQDINETIREIRSCGVKIGVSIKPETCVSKLVDVLEKVDMVLIMTVEPGFGGQLLIRETLPKISEIRKMITTKGLDTDVQVDGGITLDNIHEVITAGANVIVSGSAIFKGDIMKNVRKFIEVSASIESQYREAN